MIRTPKVQRTFSSLIANIPESSNLQKRSHTPISNKSAFVRKKIVIGPIETVCRKHKDKYQSKIQEATNENSCSINLVVNNSSSRIFNQVNKSIVKTSFLDQFSKATKEIPVQKSVVCLNPQILFNPALKETRVEVENKRKDDMVLTKAGYGCKMVTSMELDQWDEEEERGEDLQGRVKESMEESMLLESFACE